MAWKSRLTLILTAVVLARQTLSYIFYKTEMVTDANCTFSVFQVQC